MEVHNESNFESRKSNTFLKSNFKIPNNLPSFYKGMLTHWKEIKYDKSELLEDICNNYIWYNAEIAINKHTLFSKHFIDKGILKVKHIVNKNGNFLSFEELCNKYDIDNAYGLFYIGIVNAIPGRWKNILKLQQEYSDVETCLVQVKGKKYNKYNLNKIQLKELYSDLVFKKLDRSKANINFSKLFNVSEEQWKNIYIRLQINGIPNSFKEIQYKIIHDYIPTNKLLFKMGKLDSPRCNFCHLYTQNTCHLFYDCFVIMNFWFKIEEWLLSQYGIVIRMNSKYAILGVENVDDFVNVIVVCANSYIFKSKYKSSDPNIDDFQNFLSKYQIL